MESRFDLTGSRAAWLATLEASQAFSGAQLQELESHLDDAMEDLMQRGLTLPESFMIATRRLGGPAGLAKEYQKLASNPIWAVRGKWMVLGIISYLTANAVTGTCMDILGLLAIGVPGGNPRLAVTVCGFLLSSVLGVWLLHRFLRGKFPRRPDFAMRHPLRAAISVLVAAAIIPAVVGLLANFLKISTVGGLAAYGEQMAIKRYTLMAGSLLWLAVLTIPLLRCRRKAFRALPSGSA